MVTVLSKPSCVQCVATYRKLDASGVKYVVRDMSEDLEAVALAKELGYLQAPVVISGDQHWSGFRPDLISQLA